MSKITGLKTARGREKRINLYLDGRFALKLQAETALEAGLRVGQELSPESLEDLTGQDIRRRGYNTAVRFLAYRPRSESEVRQRLRRAGYDTRLIEETLLRLKSQGLVDDAAFARFWRENRETFRPRSRRLTRLELMKKGIKTDVIEEALNGADDSDSAYRAGMARAGRLPTGDFTVFSRRLGQYLTSKGFDYGTVRETVTRVWRECAGPGGQLPDNDQGDPR